jgi:hypothetical protein
MIPVKKEFDLARLADSQMRGILGDLGDFLIAATHVGPTDPRYDLDMRAESAAASLRFAIEIKSRITPQTAEAIVRHVGDSVPAGSIPVLFAPVISPRVAEIARRGKVSYLDGAGNCWLYSTKPPLLVERRGLKVDRPLAATSKSVDLFAPKSSRIIRALLSRPREGWQVQQLASHPDAQVSAGLASRIKHALVEESYAIEHNRRLYLLDPEGLLKAWSARYPGPAEQIPLYVRGDLEAAEAKITEWCGVCQLQSALAGFSAAWRLAPEVRHSVAAVYVEERGFLPTLLSRLSDEFGAQRVDSGANLLLWRPFDPSVLASLEEVRNSALPATSPLQTYLDLKQLAGRGPEAADALFQKHLQPEFREAASQGKKLKDGPV